MDTINILNYLEKRQLGYAGFKSKLSYMFIDKIGYISQSNDTDNSNIGNTFACKFSRNKNNLHIVGCSTEHGEIIVLNTVGHFNDQEKQYRRNHVHDNAIFNFAWAEPQMKLITACGDQSTKLCNLNPSGRLDEEREFMYSSSVKCVMFCPGSSDVFCGGSQDGSIKIWDARVNNGHRVLEFEHNIPNTHGIYEPMSKKKKSRKIFGVSSVIFKTDQTVISCSSMDYAIKLWDLRKSYRQVNGNIEPLPLTKYFNGNKTSPRFNAYTDIIINPQSTLMYASCIDNRIYCYSLESTETKPICIYSGHLHETTYSKISISHDGRYLFSGCMNNMGLIWSTDFPYKEKPMFEIKSSCSFSKKELSASDWCADPASTKLVTSSDSMPEMWSILTLEQRKSEQSSFHRTSSYTPKSFSTKISTVPIKFETELGEKFKKETEETMSNWDIQNQNIVPMAEDLNVTPKKPWNVLFNTKTTFPSSISSQNEITSTHSALEDSNMIPEAVTPTSSKKRKKSVVSPRSLIDQYLVPNSKREKLDTVNEI
ncbi:denticleless protein homolog B [Rhopalosiphum maidis]|uniref:denticleless protein homolog B n=1 Tax=Rhopalosiphum maidis TaxID=43146 RepID=UPI000EFE6011|nr:denticleless protein homolog B [Rhopalosiphum maidis]XP_026818723.1 denticleless protein homolog B [Rhopalosiphum maidis]